MAIKLTAGFQDDLDIADGWTIEWAAVDPNTGAAVAGVKVSHANVVAGDVSTGAGTGGGETVGPYMLVPGPGA